MLELDAVVKRGEAKTAKSGKGSFIHARIGGVN
jgi:hypothetical protein